VYGYFLSTALLWHGTFSINSVMHLFGRRAYATTDDSRNSFVFALLTMGEGWHNNHHWAPGSAAQGFRWWQIDPSFYLLWLLERTGLVRSLHRRPRHWRDAVEPALRPHLRLGAAPLARAEALLALGEGARERKSTAHETIRELGRRAAAPSRASSGFTPRPRPGARGRASRESTRDRARGHSRTSEGW
jgi:hypothetical protein